MLNSVKVTCLSEGGGRERYVNIPCEILTLFYPEQVQHVYHSSDTCEDMSCLALKVSF